MLQPASDQPDEASLVVVAGVLEEADEPFVTFRPAVHDDRYPPTVADGITLSAGLFSDLRLWFATGCSDCSGDVQDNRTPGTCVFWGWYLRLPSSDLDACGCVASTIAQR